MTKTKATLCFSAVAAAAAGVFVFAISGKVFAQDSNPSADVYMVQPGDQLLISVWKEEDLLQEVLIRPDGGFSFPLAGDMSAAEKSVETISQELSARLRRYIPDLVVTVAVTAINGNKIYVIGQVNNPGAFVMNPRVDVMQALSMAGGTTPFADLNDIKILRRSKLGQTVFPFRYNDVARGRKLSQNVMLESGTWDLSDHEVFDDSDGPTNLEAWELAERRDGEAYAPTEPVAEDPSDEERLNRAAADLLKFAEAFLGTCPGKRYRAWIGRKDLEKMAAAAVDAARGRN